MEDLEEEEVVPLSKEDFTFVVGGKLLPATILAAIFGEPRPKSERYLPVEGSRD